MTLFRFGIKQGSHGVFERYLSRKSNERQQPVVIEEGFCLSATTRRCVLQHLLLFLGFKHASEAFDLVLKLCIGMLDASINERFSLLSSR